MFGFGKPQPKPMMGQAQQMYGQNTGAKQPPPMTGGGLGPSMQTAGNMMQNMGMKPPQTPPMGQPMQGVSTGIKPPVPSSAYFPPSGMNQPPPFMKPGMQMDQPQGGIGPSMDAFSQMMQDPTALKTQAPQAMGQQPDFMRQPPQDRMKMY